MLFCLSLATTVCLATGCFLLEGSSSSSEKESGGSSSSSISESSASDESSSSSIDQDSSESSKDDSSESSSENNSSENSSGNNSSESSSENNSSENSSENDKNDPEFPDTYPTDGNCVFGEWELHRAADCDTKGIKVRHCTAHENENHDDYEWFAARNHSYNTLGICSICEDQIAVPVADKNATYLDPQDPTSGISGSGDEYVQEIYIPEEDRVEQVPGTGKYRLYVDGYFTLEIGNEGTCWFDFNVPAPGQYAVLSTSNADGVILEQYASSEATNFKIGDAMELEDGNFLSVASCTKAYYSPYWTGSFRLSGAPGDTVKIFIVKVAEPTWEAAHIVEQQYATELTTEVAPNGEKGAVATVVPYTSAYFFDETSGYYRMGTKDKPGAIIYMAIDKNAERLLGSESFISLQEIWTPAVRNLQVGYTVEGDVLHYDYAPMLYSDPAFGGVEHSYQTYLNADGMYPVTQELYQFLCYYTNRNTAVTPPPEGSEDKAWLSACYYYVMLKQGEEGNPFEITQLGDFTITQYGANKRTFLKFTYDPNPESEYATSTVCTITVKTEAFNFWIDGVRYSSANGPQTFEVDSELGIMLSFLNIDRSPIALDVEFTIALAETTEA